MFAAGNGHTVFIRSNGSAVAGGQNDFGQCILPDLDEGLTYVQAAAGGSHSVLVRSDGSAVSCGCNDFGQCTLPELDEGVTYVQAAAGKEHTVLIRSDGSAVACGRNCRGSCTLPELEEGLTYVQASAGYHHTVLIRSDGSAVACGRNHSGECTLPELGEGLTYVQAEAGAAHTVLLRSDGSAAACGSNWFGACDLPELDEGLTYVQAAAGSTHTVLIRSDGSAVFCGSQRLAPGRADRLPWLLDPCRRTIALMSNDGSYVFRGRAWLGGQCMLLEPDEGLMYVQAVAGSRYSVLIRSDGSAVACGQDGSFEYVLPELDAGVDMRALCCSLVLQACFHGSSLQFVNLAGERLCHLEASASDRLAGVRAQLMRMLGSRHVHVDVILPNGQRLDQVVASDRMAVLHDYLET